MYVEINRRLRMAPATALILLIGACGDGPTEPQEARIRVDVETSGGDPDDEYLLTIAETKRPVEANMMVFSVVSAGTHSVALEGVATNCSVTGANPLSVDVPAGRTVNVSFEVVCAQTGIEVTARTTGLGYPFGFQLAVHDQASPISQQIVSVGVNSSRVISRLRPGSYVVALHMPSDHCTVSGAHPITIEVSNRALTPLQFDIECVPPVRSEKIAHIVDAPSEPGGFHIAVVNPDGSGAQILGLGHSPAWSPDGTKLVYSQVHCTYYYGCYGSLQLMDPEIGSTVALTNGYGGFSPAWSPTGDAIAYVADGRLYRIALDGSLPVPIFTGPGMAADPDWSPDGQRIALGCMTPTGNSDICVINRDGTGLVRLPSDGSSETQPEWSPDGSRIAFTRGQFITEVAVMNADGSGVTRLTPGSDPTWSRDGARLAFTYIDGLYTMTADGSGVVRIITGNRYAPAWRP